MKKHLVFRQAAWHDEPLIAHFYLEGFPAQAEYKYPDRFKWMYKNNPFYGNSNSLPVWLAIHGGKIVGMAALMPQEFSINGNTVVGAWCCDFRILPEYQGMGVGTRLERMRKKGSNAFSVTSSGVSMHIKQTLGYSSRYSHTLFLHVKRFDSNSLYDDFMRYLHLNRVCHLYNVGLKLKIHNLLSLFLLCFFKVKQKCGNRKNYVPRSGLNFIRINTFSKDVDVLWNQVKHRYSLAVKRNSFYLNWKFVEQPRMNYQRYLVYLSKRLCGVLVFRIANHGELPIGIISEFYTSENSQVLCEMLHFAFSSLYEQGASMIQSTSSTDETSQILRRFGFIPLKTYYGAFRLLPSAASYRKTIASGQWLITSGDHDLDERGRTHHPSLLALLIALKH